MKKVIIKSICQFKVIWDFDDDNEVKFWIEHSAPEERLDLDYYAFLHPGFL